MSKTHYDVSGQIIAYESGELNQEQTIELFQYLVNTGLAWQLQGCYGRTTTELVKAGEITLPRHTHPLQQGVGGKHSRKGEGVL